jgi:photosystem II stability/assembly factor-like uncharacterized protein
MRRALLIVACAALSPAAFADGGLTSWEPLGPGTAGSIVRAIAIDPNDPDRIVIGSPGGGIWRTVNGGDNWSFVTAGAPSQVVSSLAMAPSNPSILYAGTGESFAVSRGAPGAGMLKSVDGGGTWTPLASTASWATDDNRFVNFISVHPNDPNLVLVATDAALQRSTDGGQTWDNPPPRVGRVTEVHFYDWNGTGYAVAGLEPNSRFKAPASPPTVGQDLDCALYSTDYGVTWNVSEFHGVPGEATVCVAAGSGANEMWVDSGADFQYLDYVKVGNLGAGNEEIVQVLSVTEGCNCCSGGSGVTCDDNDCSTLVCATRPSCCSTTWDSQCDVLADQLCTCCSGACPSGGDRIGLRGGSFTQAHSVGEPVQLKVSQRVALGINADTLATYASMGAGGGTIWKSSNLGADYFFVSNPNEEDGSEDLDFLYTGTTARAFYSNVIWAASDPLSNEDLVVVGGVEALRSTDSGETFTSITRGVRFDEGTSAHIDHHALVPDPRFPSVPSLYFGNDGGVQRADNISTVQQESGWTNLACTSGIVEGECSAGSPDLGLGQLWCGSTTADGEWLLGGGQDIDAVVREPAGGFNGWTLWNGVGDARGCAIGEDPSGSVDIYNLRNNQVWKINACESGTVSPPAACTTNSDCPDNPGCTDGVCNCLSVNQTSGCPSSTANSNFFSSGGSRACDTFTRAIAIDPNDNSKLVAGGNRLWHTSDKGDRWDEIRGSVGSRCSALEIADGDSNNIWAGYENGTVSRTQNSNPGNWVNLSLPAINSPCDTASCAVSDILIDPNDHDRVWVTFMGPGYQLPNNCCEDTVLATIDSGASWVPLMGSAPFTLPQTAAHSITLHPEEPEWLYVGTDQGVYASEDGGFTWGRTPLSGQNEGPFNILVTDLMWHDPDYLVAATYGLGMQRARAPRIVYVDRLWTGDEQGTQPEPFDTVQEAIDLAGPGATISIEAGVYNEGAISFTKRGQIVATGGNVTID